MAVPKFVYGLGDEQERIDFAYLKEFASQYPNSFKELKEAPLRSPYDASCTTKEGPALIELKDRKTKSIFNSPDCFIEPKKWNYLLGKHRDTGEIPVYINFLNEADDIYLWMLHNITEAAFHPNIMICGYKQDRIGLNWNDAWHYKRINGVYTLVHKGL